MTHAALITTLCCMVAAGPQAVPSANGPTGGAGGEEMYLVDAIAAIVNDTIITIGDIDERLGPALALIDELPTEEKKISTLATKRSQALDQMINDKLVLSVATNLGLTVSDAELDASIKDMVKASGMTVEALAANIQKLGFDSFAQYKEMMRDEILKARVVSIKVRSKLKVSEDEVDELLKSKYGGGKDQVEMHVAHIMLKLEPFDTDKVFKEKYAKLDALRTEILSGAKDFAEAAKAVSEDYSAKNGGDIGSFAPGNLDEQFEAAAFALDEGQLSAVVQSQFGLHIIKCLGKKSTSLDEEALKKLKDQIRFEILDKKFAKAYSKWIDTLRDKATIKVFLAKDTAADDDSSD